MSKIAAYLGEHIVGDITAAKYIRERYSRDGGVLEILPELVLFPRVTNDIRKAARFAWQLAEKGHVLGLTARGNGTDTTGGAIGKGLVVATNVYLDHVIQLNVKDKLVHVQPGVEAKTLLETLSWQGLSVPALSDSKESTIGGALARNIGSRYSGKSGLVEDAVERLEVVLANGDLIETGLVSKREVSRKIGLQTFEGEIYRKLDGLIEENEELIDTINKSSARDNGGYAHIARVKDKHGNYNLTPLFIGSQGTLGIISEAVLKTELSNPSRASLVAYIHDKSIGRDVCDELRKLEPAALETIDGELYAAAVKAGRVYPFKFTTDDTGIVIYAEFDDMHDRKRDKKLKKAAKKLELVAANILTSLDTAVESIDAIRYVSQSLAMLDHGGEVYIPLLDGMYIPDDRFEAFTGALYEHATKHLIALPIVRRILDSTISIKPLLDLSKVGDKQKVLRLEQELAVIVVQHGGSFIGEGGEGRLRSNALRASLSEETVKLYDDIRAIFDPYGTLNPGVKQAVETKDLIAALTNSYDPTINL